MKYMTFNSSCSYTGVANMLAQYGVDTDDRTIAREMKLPLLFYKEDGAYLAGPMLQSAEWFDLYLNSIGYRIVERWSEREDVPEILERAKTVMLGLRLSSKGKHAVVYRGMDDDRFVFLNNKWKHTDEPERLAFTRAELLERLDERCVMAELQPAEIRKADFEPLFKQSVRILEELKQDLRDFCGRQHTQQEIRAQMDPLFRAILLDAVTMLELSEKNDLADKLRGVQRAFLAAMRKEGGVTLTDEISLETLLEAIDEYAAWIGENID